MFTDYLELATVIVFVIAVVVILYQQVKAGKAVTVADVVAAVTAAQPITARVRTVAEGAVLALEQIKREGRITNEAAYRRAFAEIRKQFPQASGVSDEEIMREINRAVLIGSKITADIKAATGDKIPEAKQEKRSPAPPSPRVGTTGLE